MQRFASKVATVGAILIVIATADHTAAQTSAPQGQRIAETHWSGRTSWDGPSLEAGEWTLYFRSDGVLVYSTGGAALDNGHWRQRDTLVTFETNNYSTVFVGFAHSDVLEGVTYNSNGQQGTGAFRRQSSNGAEICPQNMVALRGTTAPLVCACPPGIAVATVWGDQSAYTDDSHICTAAIHAGIVTAQAGGRITVTPRPGRDSYPASNMNGVTTLPYGSWEASYTVGVARPDGKAK